MQVGEQAGVTMGQVATFSMKCRSAEGQLRPQITFHTDLGLYPQVWGRPLLFPELVVHLASPARFTSPDLLGWLPRLHLTDHSLLL